MKIEKFLNGDFINMPSKISKLIKFEKTIANSFAE